MTNYIILAFCVIIILAYLFDLSGRFSRIPGVLFLILLGMLIQVLSESTGFSMPNLKPYLPVIGTLGLVMIIMEAALGIKLGKDKKAIIIDSLSAAIILFAVSVAIFSFIMVRFLGLNLHVSLLNAIPLSIISSSVAIPSASFLNGSDHEFVVYESSFSDIFGIMIFDLILLNDSSIASGILVFFRNGIVMIIIALISTGLLGYLLHKTTFHVNYIIILTFIILIYSLSKLINLPSLILVLIFGLLLSNIQLFGVSYLDRYIDFKKFRGDIDSFRRVLGELTFLVRSFFFILFGYYTTIAGILNIENLLSGLIISLGILFLRWQFFRHFLRMPSNPLVFFAPRGLLTILLFMSIPEASRIGIISENVVTVVILTTIILMTLGNLTQRRSSRASGKNNMTNDTQI